MAAQLLPPSATPQEVAIELATARVELVPTPVRAMWSPADIPAQHLPWLAWAFCVPSWDVAWTEDQRRTAIQTSLSVLKHRGTPAAVIESIAALFRGAGVQEWHNQTPPGLAYTFRLLLDVTEDPLERELLFKLLGVANDTKNLRSHVSAIAVSATTQASLYVASTTGFGIELQILPGPGAETPLVYDGAPRHDGNQTYSGHY